MLEVREHIAMISRDMAKRERRKRRSREGGRMDTMEGGEMADRIEACGEKEERVMDAINKEMTGELVTVLGRDTTRKLEVKGQTGADEVVVVGHLITSQMLTQQKTNLFQDVRGKGSTEKMPCHQLKQELLELD